MNRKSRSLLLFLIGAALAGLAWVGWRCSTDARVPFLPAHGTAEWIVFPKPFDTQGRAAVELYTEFRSVFVLPAVETNAVLALRVFRRATVIVNGSTMSWSPTANWKRAQTIPLGPYLRAGTNRLAIVVTNDYGPPALWAEFTAGTQRLRTDESWQASCAGSSWQSARLARRPPPIRPGSPVLCELDLRQAVRSQSPVVLVFGILSLALILLISRRQASGPSATGTESGLLVSDPALFALVAAALVWVVLFVHNLALLPPRTGFDVDTHNDYIQYIMERRALPLAHEGASMYNPPLYYLICAFTLATGSSTPHEQSGVILIRLLSLGAGLAHLLFVFASLRLLFPAQPRRQTVGVLLAACVPIHLVLCHYPTNEVLLAMLATASVYFCLRLLRSDTVTPGSCALVGLCVGAALLTKPTAVILPPFIFGAVVLRLWPQCRLAVPAWLRTAGVMFAVCLVVCGWHYIRVWLHFGKPLVGAWEAVSGHRWWQDPGYRMSADFLRFGTSLIAPIFSGHSGVLDGAYSTLWGDGLCGGAAAAELRPPWNYPLMFLGYWLGVMPTFAILVGGGLCLWRFVRRPSLVWFVVNGIGFSMTCAFYYLVFQVPYYSQIKAFYAILALLPFAAFGAVGLDALARGKTCSLLVSVLLGTWALTSLSSLWIPRNSPDTQVALGLSEMERGQYAAAIDRLSAIVRQHPRHLPARSFLAQSLAALGRADESLEVADFTLREWPENASAHADAGVACQMKAQTNQALAHFRQAVMLAPDLWRERLLIASLLAGSSRPEEAILSCREGLAVRPETAELRLLLASLLADAPHGNGAGGDGSNHLAEAREQLRLAGDLAGGNSAILNNAAWLLATHSEDLVRDGALAARLAERACRLTGYRAPLLVGTLAAAQAEAGQFSDAVTTAQKAQGLAEAAGQAQLADLNQKLAALFRQGKPYRQRPGAATPSTAPQ